MDSYFYELIETSQVTSFLFRHTRLGLNGEPFIMYKFRTLNEQGKAIHPFLRRTGLD